MQRFGLRKFLLRSKLSDILSYLHGTKMWPTHRTEMGRFRSLLRERLIMKFPSSFRIQRQVELILPSEFKARFRDRVVAVLRAGMAFGQIRRVGGDLVGDDAVFDVFFVRQTEMFFRRDVTKHGAAVPADHRRADRAGDVIVAGRDVGGERAERVERRFVAPLELFLHVLFNHVHRDVARAFVHYLHMLRPGALGQLALRVKFGELRFIVRISD